MKKYILITSNESETMFLGRKLSKLCVSGCVICLIGMVGSGKTTLCKGFLRALGYMGGIKSPTYTLVESYFISSKHVVVHHFDFYRLSKEENLNDIGMRDYFNGESICLIEWPEQGSNILSLSDVIITISYYNQEISRKIVLESFSDFGKNIIRALLYSGILMHVVT